MIDAELVTRKILPVAVLTQHVLVRLARFGEVKPLVAHADAQLDPRLPPAAYAWRNQHPRRRS